MAKKLEASPYPVERAERLAKIMGENSTTAKALIEMKRRQDAGEIVELYVAGSMIFVGPPLSR